MTNNLELAKVIVLTALRYLLDKNGETFIDVFDENELVQQFVKEIDYSDSIFKIKKIIMEYKADDLNKILNSKEFYQMLKNMDFNEDEIAVLQELM